MSIPRGVAGALALLLLAPSSATPQETTTLTLEAALAAVQEQHPQLAAALLQSEVAGHRADQAGRLPNPEITAYQESFPGAEPGADQWILSLSQRLRIGGQLGIASEAAVAGQRASAWDVEAVRARLTLEVQRVYVLAHADRERLQAVGRALEASRAMLRDLQLRNAEGDVSDFDVGRLQIDVEALELRSAELREELRHGWIRLAALTGLTPPDGGWVLVPPETQPGGPPPPHLDVAAAGTFPRAAGPSTTPEEGAVSSGRPEVLAAMERERQAALLEKLARRQAVPDLVVTGGYSRIDPGRDGFVWSINAVIPLFDRNRDAAAAAAAEERIQQRRVEILERQAWSQRRQALNAFDSTTAVLRELAPRREEDLLRTARVAYEEGEMGVVPLLDTVRAGLEARLRHIELRRRRSEAWFLWKWASGQTAGDEVTR